MATLIIEDLSVSEELDHEEMAEVRGGAIYVDGQYWGEGSLDLRAWPGGAATWNVWPDGSRTPY
ncbi:MAG TPA: hypothetical protein VJ673_17210 [Aromatoleum sp.]|uniref:hypothetical protein n=1 Tax=Aromatoleum sp. TaxID=2307007 RepID=UPI002B47CBC6|nr:hypothetical protein [Aromatoleum sp.]HJV27430.1 hypothetical protein [Aromatoleum sp.]